MISISVNKLSLSFGTSELFSDVTFALNEGDRLGIIGVNGCGKSTLFKLITGEYQADSGNIYISKDKTLGILRQDGAFEHFGEGGRELSALEVMYFSFPELLELEKKLRELERVLSEKSFTEGRDEESYASEFARLNERFIAEGGLEFRGRCASTLLKMGFDERAMALPFELLSGGQRTRLALSRELCREPDILLLDEPTNHLDIETLGWLESFLASYKKTLLVISHDRYFLDKVTNKTLVIENKRAAIYNGGYTKSMKQRETDREIAERHYRNQQKEIARQEAYIAQQRAWNRERNIIAAESRQKLLDKMTLVERPKEAPKPVNIRFSSSLASGNDVLTVKELSFAFPDMVNEKLIDSLSFVVKKGDRLFIVGPNGCGKSTLIKLMMGRLMPTGGYIESGYNVQVGYYDQENQNLTAENTVIDELWNAYPTLTSLKIRNTLALFRFFGDDVFKSVSMLSGGERARLTLAKLILSEMNVLILDEPTNHLDIDSREALEKALEEFDGTVITVSHDRYFLSKLATRIIDMTAEAGSSYADIRVTRRGDAYEELTSDRERRSLLSEGSSAPTANSESAGSAKEQYLLNKQKNAEERKQKKRLERLEAEAKKLEEELRRVEAEMMGEAATDYIRVAELDARKNEIEERLLEIYEEI
ncbi:MAG: ABC-F family ATP-binding cassette domain-containing protein [Ruminococcaceae bacterium]|nr:ABC-F family ATP-binding cassette domain-containing protein [Oscillospiraceae bacterium]